MEFEVLHQALYGRPDVVLVDTVHQPGLWGPCFTHHSPHNNDPRWAADTTTESVLRFLAAGDAGQLARCSVVTTNHFDADALAPVWSLLHPAAALARRERLERLARCGDFFLHLDEPSARLNFAIEAMHWRLRAAGTPGERLVDDALTRRCFEHFLPRLAELLDDADAEPELWREPMRRLLEDRAELQRPGRVTELWDLHASLVELDREPDRHALNTECRNDLLVLWRTDSGERRVEVRPAIAWYDLASLPHRPRYDLEALALRLDEAERAAGGAAPWICERGPARVAARGSKLSQGQLLDALGGWLAAEPEANVPALYRRDVREVFRHWPEPAVARSHERFRAARELSWEPDAPYAGLYRLAPLRAGGPVRFAVSDEFAWNVEPGAALELAVALEDRGAGRLHAEYDAWSGAHRATEVVELTGSGSLRSVRWPLDGARLANGQAGADLQLVRGGASCGGLRWVSLRKL